MISNPDQLIARILARLATLEGVRGLAIVGSRAHIDSSWVDEYSDLDVLVCVQSDEWPRLMAADWVNEVEKPVLVFPRIEGDKLRLLFAGLFACELHIKGVEQVEKMNGPCRFGSEIQDAFKIVYDPEGLLSRLQSRVSPEQPKPRDAQVTSSVFWYNLAYCANLVARGDFFRASHMANWFLKLFLLNLLYPIDEPDARKYVARKLLPKQYAALAAGVSPLTFEGMSTNLKQTMECYWQFQAEAAPDLDPALLASYRCIEQDILTTLAHSALLAEAS